MIRDLPLQPDNRILRSLARGIVASVLTVACFASVGVQTSSADQLDDRRKVLDQQLVSQAAAVDDANAQALAALRAFKAAKAELADARAQLAKAEAATAAARKLDAQRASELAEAEHKVTQAEADVAAAQAAFDSVDARTNEEITVITQQNGPLVDLALIFGDLDSADLNQRAQLGETLLDYSALELDELTSRRFKLDAAKTAADDARAAAEQAREAAASALKDTEAKEAAAAALQDKVTQKVRARDAAQEAAQEQVALEERRQADLESESAAVDKRIAERIAAEEARRKAAEAAARKAAAEKAAAEAAARKKAADAAAAQRARDAAARAAAAKSSGSAAKPSAPKPAAAPAKPATSSNSAASSSSGFLRPVDGRLSSSYGMRLHPVLGYWKLHDGTDFAASCGTPIRAAYAGTVSDKYYNAGYGNRLMIDHGRVDGDYVTTGYNHATRYVVGVGDHVARGQVIGYVGTTGYSTGCHLHLMVWENGSKVNPMTKWFD